MSNVDDDTIEILARQRRQEVPPKVHHVQRRVLGVEMLPLLLTATALGMALTLVLLVTDHLIAAIVLFVLTIVLGVFLRTGIRHEPDSEISRASLRANDRTRSRLHVGTVAARAWSRAAPSL